MNESSQIDVGIVGAGAWGTTLASLLCWSGRTALLWAYETEVAREINTARINSVYLPDIDLPENLVATNEISDMRNAERLIIAVPSAFFPETLGRLAPHVSPTARVVSATKGFVGPELLRPTQLLQESLPSHPVGVLSGPNLSREVVRGLPAISLIASENEELVQEYQQLLSNDRFRIYGGSDVAGTELGGALKNIIALAAGLADGLRLGQNALAGLITRGLAEIIRLGSELGANQRTFFGVSGLGDLVCTSQSNLSRNHEVGRRIATGEKLEAILEELSAVPEGPTTTLHVHEFAVQHNLDLPITRGVHGVLFQNADPAESLRELMTRALKME